MNVIDLPSLGVAHLEDPDVGAYARRTGRVIISFDLDFAELHRRGQYGQFGVVILRLGVQTVAAVNRARERFVRTEPGTFPLNRSLVVIDETRMRITTTP